ncbi:cytochrome P450 52A12 [Didymella exigua CBS 183.55]|uniref:Cytochrome P450 52A12 n=1 Tax=Didymella exigua CBS 183.55 TaxID=1150837 RepID=A0A6A5RB01_9PLEO|nr:cytochrome P450 52A12 [Didymella exigua CBS 183.55]KAF1924703.1 cytochrome P450 52A12 [Didymella exigua CBS 183.55]
MLVTYLLGATITFIVYSTISTVSTKRRHAVAAKRLGCGPTPMENWPDPFALTNLFRTMWALSNNTILDYMRSTFDKTSANKTVHTYETKILGDKVIFTSDPKNIQAMLATQFKDFELGQVRRGSFAPLLGHGVFSADGEQWERARAILRPQFTRDQVGDLELEERHVQNMLQALPTEAGDWSEVIDLQPLFLRLSMDSTSEFLFGQSTDTQLSMLSEGASTKNVEDTVFVEAFETCQRRIMMAMLLNEFYALIQTKNFVDKCRLCHCYIDKFVSQALSRHEGRDQMQQLEKERYIFADKLASETSDPIELRNQLLSILVAGRDTTASFMSFLFLMLAQHPEVYNRLRTTILEDFGTFQSPKDITFAGLKACAYLQWCMNETLRLYPPVPWNSRRSTRDTSLPSGGGEDGLSPIFVPKGTETVYIVWLMQRRPAFWGADAEQFRPERWQDHKHGGFEYLPFNGGPRICVGQQNALTKTGYVVVRLLQRFDKMARGAATSDPIEWSFSLTGRPKDGVKVRLHAAPER